MSMKHSMSGTASATNPCRFGSALQFKIISFYDIYSCQQGAKSGGAPIQTEKRRSSELAGQVTLTLAVCGASSASSRSSLSRAPVSSALPPARAAACAKSGGAHPEATAPHRAGDACEAGIAEMLLRACSAALQPACPPLKTQC